MEHNPTIVSDKETRGRSATGFNGAIKAQTAYAVPDRVVGLEELDELRRLCPWRVWNFVRVHSNLCPTLTERQRKVEVDVSYEVNLSTTITDEFLNLPTRKVRKQGQS